MSVLTLAILHASNDPQEAPWYGPWNIVLEDMFRNFCPATFYTATYPQFPLVKDTDIVDSEEEESDNEMDDQARLYPLLIKYQLINSVLQMKRYRRSAAPSPDSPLSFKSHRSGLSQIPPINSVLQAKNYRRSAAPAADSPEAYRSGLPQTPPKLSPSSIRTKKRRSVRIPDFAQLLFRIRINKSDGTLLDYRTGVLLLVEIKKAKTSCQIYDFVQVLLQTNQQARHAFASYPGVDALGMVVALGDCWTYREYLRSDMKPSPGLSESIDPTFVDSGSDSDTPDFQPVICEDVEEAFENFGFARLQSNTSNKALAIVRKRLINMASTMFCSGCNGSCCFCRTALKFQSRIVISTRISLWLPVVCWMV